MIDKLFKIHATGVKNAIFYWPCTKLCIFLNEFFRYINIDNDLLKRPFQYSRVCSVFAHQSLINRTCTVAMHLYALICNLMTVRCDEHICIYMLFVHVVTLIEPNK